MSVANYFSDGHADGRFATRKTATFAEMSEAMQRHEFTY